MYAIHCMGNPTNIATIYIEFLNSISIKLFHSHLLKRKKKPNFNYVILGWIKFPMHVNPIKVTLYNIDIESNNCAHKIMINYRNHYAW